MMIEQSKQVPKKATDQLYVNRFFVCPCESVMHAALCVHPSSLYRNKLQWIFNFHNANQQQKNTTPLDRMIDYLAQIYRPFAAGV